MNKKNLIALALITLTTVICGAASADELDRKDPGSGLGPVPAPAPMPGPMPGGSGWGGRPGWGHPGHGHGPRPVVVKDIFKFYSGHTFLQTDFFQEGANLGMRPMGVSFRVATYPMPGMQAVFLCKAGAWDYFISTAPTCENQQFIRQLGFVYAQPFPGAGPALFRCYTGRAGGTHLTTSNPAAECGGMQVEGGQGYSVY